MQKKTAPPPTNASFGSPKMERRGLDTGGPTTSTPGAGPGSQAAMSDPMAGFETVEMGGETAKGFFDATFVGFH